MNTFLLPPLHPAQAGQFGANNFVNGNASGTSALCLEVVSLCIIGLIAIGVAICCFIKECRSSNTSPSGNIGNAKYKSSNTNVQSV